MRKALKISVIAVPLLCLCLVGAYFLPPVHDRLAWRLDNAVADLRRWINPPESLVFQPQQGGARPETTPADVLPVVQATLTAIRPLAATPGASGPISPEMDPTPATVPATAAPTIPPAPTATPTPTIAPTPIPPARLLTGIVHEYQQFNNCGPANLAMALSYWGWDGDQRQTRAFLRPNLEVDDKNVNPEEMVAFVEGSTGLKALTRVGGDPELLKKLLAAGFPVIVEAGHHPRDDWWMGHYLVISGYDDLAAKWTMQDSLLNPDLAVPYDEFGPRWWRDFNYVYVLIYPAEKESEVAAILGPRLDPGNSYRLAEELALADIAQLRGQDLFFAWFNLGSSRVGLQDYSGAAEAYDQAFALYQTLTEDMRPYRLMWYQAGPYVAYYQTGRYQDVITLANTTFTWVGKGVLEESYYWRGMAYSALGQTNAALRELQKAAALNPNYAAPREALQALGVTP